jgi:hypothetical protein
MSANDNSQSLQLRVVGSGPLYSITLNNFTGVGISSSGDNIFTFNLSGTYLFQYNLNFNVDTQSDVKLLLNGTTGFGVQTIQAQLGSCGCSVIYNVVAGNYVSLVIDNSSATISFASLTIIKI